MVEVEYSGGGPGSSAQHDFRNDYLTRADETAVIEQVPAVAYSSPMLQMHDRISFGNGVVKDILVLGVSPQYRQVRNLILIAGRFFDDEDDVTHAKVAVVTEPLRQAEVRHHQSPSIRLSRSTASRSPSSAPSKRRWIHWDKPRVADQTILIPYSVARYFTGTNNVKQIFFSDPRHRRCRAGNETDPAK